MEIRLLSGSTTGKVAKSVRDVALARLRRISGRNDFNPASIVQVRWLLYDHLKFPLQKRYGYVATNNGALLLLALHAETEEQRAALRSLVQWRRKVKQ